MHATSRSMPNISFNSTLPASVTLKARVAPVRRNPSEFQKPPLQLGADQPTHTIAPLAPVQAGPAEDALAAAVGFKPGSEVAEEAVACVGSTPPSALRCM